MKLHFPSPLLLSIFFLAIVSINCKATCPGQIAGRSPLDIYDEAINLYFKPPYQRKAALQLLESACECPKAKQRALSCHNLGVLYELRGERRAAIAAYKKAESLHRHPWFSLALQRNQKMPSFHNGSYKFYVNQMLESCHRKNPQKAIQYFQNMLGNLSPEELPKRPLLSQSFFQDCLANQRNYRALLLKLPKSRESQQMLVKNYYKELAKLHPLAGLFDIELYLRRELRSKNSHRAITAAWQGFLKASRNGNKKQAAKSLKEMFVRLGQAARKHPALSGKALALKRAASVLIDRDAYFRRVRNFPEIQKQIRPFLR